MIKYAEIIDEIKGLVNVGIGDNSEFYESIGMVQMDVEQSDLDDLWYLTEKCPHKSEEQKEQERKEQRNREIKEKISELQIMALSDILQGNKENIKLYNEVINGLEAAKEV